MSLSKISGLWYFIAQIIGSLLDELTMCDSIEYLGFAVLIYAYGCSCLLAIVVNSTMVLWFGTSV